MDTKAKPEYPLRLRLGYPPESEAQFSCFAARKEHGPGRPDVFVADLSASVQLWCLYLTLASERRPMFLVRGEDASEVGWGGEPKVLTHGAEIAPLPAGSRVVPSPRRQDPAKVRRYGVWLYRYTARGLLSRLFANEVVSFMAGRSGGIPSVAPELVVPRSYKAEKPAERRKSWRRSWS